MNFYQRKLPHWQPAGAQYFITFRLAGSLPKKVIEELRLLRERFENTSEQKGNEDRRLIQRKIFQKYEEALDSGNTGPKWLNNPSITKIVQEAMHYRDTKEYNLFAYCVMINHNY